MYKWNIWFYPTQKPTLRKTPRAFLATAPVDNNKLDGDKLQENMFNILHCFRLDF